MLKNENRLKKKKDFERVYKSQNRAYFPEMIIQWAPRSQKDLPSRFGFVISNKISKSSVKKNRAKRLLREAVRGLIKEKITPTGFDFAINCKKPILENDYQDLYRRINLFFKNQK